MEHIIFNNKSYPLMQGETVLETLLRQGVDITHSCKKGTCHACKCQQVSDKKDVFVGTLSESLVEQGYFLPCRTMAVNGINFISHTSKSSLPSARDELSEESQLDALELPYPEPCIELWKALGERRLLQQILNDFYDLVFEDDVLSPYFQRFTKQRSKEKVYSFYRRIFSGDPVFFGDRPRNSHSWMVISDEVFDYRLDLLTSVMRKHHLPEVMISRWLEYENYYRKDIVKSEPRARKVGEHYQPVNGFGFEVLAEGTVCDSCQGFLEKGEEVMYHLRTGHVYCANCQSSNLQTSE